MEKYKLILFSPNRASQYGVKINGIRFEKGFKWTLIRIELNGF
jgi:hypothetical protein